MFRKSCAALFCAALLGPVAPAGAAPVVDRDEFSTTTQVAGGKLRTSVSSQPLNFKTASGEWKAIDTTLEPGANGTVGPASVDGEVAIPASLASPVELSHDGHELSIRLKGSSGGRDEVADAGAEFEDALAGVDVEYVSTPRGVKETLRLASASGPKVFTYDVRGASAWTAATDDGDVVLRDASGKERYRITAPLAWDSAPDPAFTNALDLSVAKVSDGRWTVTLRPDAAWLTDPARTMPIYIDPDYSWSSGTTHFHGAQDCYLSGNTQANNSFCAQTYLQTGYYNRPYKSIFKFDIASAIPSDAAVSAATFKAYAPPASARALGNHRLHTITSDWDSSATWNNRKSGVPWTTAGGDISSNSSYSSSSPVAVQALSTWFTFPAPLATVQGWANGSLPNYGFLLSTDTGAPANQAYVWASTEASMSSSFPATSNEWPTLDVTWTASSGVDTTAPTAPTDLDLLALDTYDGLTGFNFTPGVDSGTNASGVDHNEYRVRRQGESSFSAWAELDGSDGVIEGLTAGETLQLEVRTVDVAANASSATGGSFTVTTGSNDDAFDDGARAWLSDAYGMTSPIAQAWIDAQARSVDLVDEIDASSVWASYAGLWFDNETRQIHVKLTDAGATSIVEDLVADHDLTSYVTIDITTVSDNVLNQGAIDAQVLLDAEQAEGWVDIGYSASQGKVTFEVTTDASASVRASIASAASSLTVPTSVTDSDGPRAVPDPQKCGPQADPSIWASEGREVGCDAPFRGGVGTNAHAGEPCTLGFNVRSISDDKPYVMTAGHCYEDSDIGTPRSALNSKGFLTPIGPLHNRYNVSVPYLWLSRYEDAAIIEATNPRLNALRPWIVYQRQGSTAAQTGEMNPQFKIAGVGRSYEGQVLCMSGSMSGTHCGTVKALGKAHGTAGYIEMCTSTNMAGATMGGDSGGPFFSKHGNGGGVANGMLSGLPNEDKPCQAQFASAAAAALKMGVWIVTTRTTANDGSFDSCEHPYWRHEDGTCITHQ